MGMKGTGYTFRGGNSIRIVLPPFRKRVLKGKKCAPVSWANSYFLCKPLFQRGLVCRAFAPLRSEHCFSSKQRPLYCPSEKCSSLKMKSICPFQKKAKTKSQNLSRLCIYKNGGRSTKCIKSPKGFQNSFISSMNDLIELWSPTVKENLENESKYYLLIFELSRWKV